MTKEKPKPFSQPYQQNWSETHKYKHIHTGEYCTFEAYVAEYLILRRAEAFKEPRPAYKFWTKGEKLYPAFVRQLKAIIKLRKKYDEDIILGAIKSTHFDKVFYVGLYAKNYVGWKMNPIALEAIECYHKERQEQQKQSEMKKLADNADVQQECKEVVRRKSSSYGKQKTLNQLRNL